MISPDNAKCILLCLVGSLLLMTVLRNGGNKKQSFTNKFDSIKKRDQIADGGQRFRVEYAHSGFSE